MMYLTLWIMNSYMSVKIIPTAVTFFAHVACKRPNPFVELIDMSTQTVKFRECFAADCSVVLNPATNFASKGFGGWHHDRAHVDELKS